MKRGNKEKRIEKGDRGNESDRAKRLSYMLHVTTTTKDITM